jgi:hypothetical protein
MEELNQRMVDVNTSLEAVWKPSSIGEFKNRTITVLDLAVVTSIVNTVSFIGCRSKEWLEIGQRLATMQELKILSVEHCDSENNLCTGISSSKSLAIVHMGRLLVTQRTAASPTKESNNCAKCSS